MYIFLSTSVHTKKSVWDVNEDWHESLFTQHPSSFTQNELEILVGTDSNLSHFTQSPSSVKQNRFGIQQLALLVPHLVSHAE